METRMGRRAFVTGAAGLAAAGMCSAASFASADEAPAEATDEEMAAWEKASQTIETVESPSSWDCEYDVVVVGSGAGGVTAATRLADAGCKVALVDKMGQIGGSSRYAMYIINLGGNQVANKYEWAYPVYPYDVDAVVNELMDEYAKTADPELLKAIFTAAPKSVDWLIDEMGCDFDSADGAATGCIQLYWNTDTLAAGDDPREKVGWGRWYDSLQDGILADHGVEIMCSTEVTNLVMDGDRVVGVKALDADGREIWLRGQKAVLLTAGGFEANRAMLQKYCPHMAPSIKATAGWNNNTGECIRMGVGAGADMCGFETGNTVGGMLEWHKYTYEPTFLDHMSQGTTVLAQPWLRLNSAGGRVPYCDVKFDDDAGVTMAQPAGNTYVFFDSKWRSLIEENHFGTWGPRYATTRGDEFQQTIDEGYIAQADTIEELAEQLGLDAGVLGEQVAKWNDACAAGEDYVSYGKYDPSWLVPLDEPPFFGACMGGELYSTKCGLRVNPSMQVISTTGRVIPGLYAGFHTAGGACGELCWNFWTLSGLSNIGLSFAGGYMAADGILANE